MLVTLQKPAFAFFQGKLRPWDECNLHISTEAVLRGLNVFEGMKAYWQADGTVGIVAVPQHWARLKQSARLLHLPFDVSLEEFEANCHALVAKLCRRESDMWVRATLFAIAGHWGVDTVTDLVLTAYHQPKTAPEPQAIGVTNWRRAPDLALTPRIKTSANYNVARLGKIEGRLRGYSEMIVLNGANRVAEALGSCVLVVRNGTVITPPSYEGALESITVDIVESLARSMNIPFVRRPLDLTEVYIADEVALAGTLVEITPISTVGEHSFSSHRPVLSALSQRYFSAVRGEVPHPHVEVSCRSVS